MNLLAATYHGRIRLSEKLPPLILTGLICPSDTDNYVSLICNIISFKNHIAIYVRQDLTNFMKFEYIFIVASEINDEVIYIYI